MNVGIDLNDKLLKLVRGKRVVLVGPASYLQGKKMGACFDNYDVVCRPNEIIPQPDMREDYGNRTDIYICNFGNYWMPGIERKIKSEDREEFFKKLKLVVGTAIKAAHADTNYLQWPDDYVSQIPENFAKINKYNLPFYWIGVRDYKKLHQAIGVEFHTGMAAIALLLHYPIKELLITGFSFYQGGSQYKELYCPGHMDDIDTADRTFGHGEHAKSRQLKYFRELLTYYEKKIKIDSYMNELLGLNHSNLLEAVHQR